MISRQFFYPRQQVASENLNGLVDDTYKIIKDFIDDWSPASSRVILTTDNPIILSLNNDMRITAHGTTTMTVSGGVGYIAQDKIELSPQTLNALTAKDYDGNYITLPGGGGGTAYTRIDTIGVRLLETYTDNLNINFIDERNNIYTQNVPTRIYNSGELVWIMGVRNPTLPVPPVDIPTDVFPLFNIYLKDSSDDYTYAIYNSDPGIAPTNCGYLVDLRGPYLYNPTTNTIAQPPETFNMFSQSPTKGIIDSVLVTRDGVISKIFAYLDIDGGMVYQTMKDISNWYVEDAASSLRMDPINFLTDEYGLAFDKEPTATTAKISKDISLLSPTASGQANLADLTFYSDIYLPTITGVEAVVITITAGGSGAWWEITQDVSGNPLSVGLNKITWNIDTFPVGTSYKPSDVVGGYRWSIAKTQVTKISVGVKTTNATDELTGIVVDNIIAKGRSSIVDDMNVNPTPWSGVAYVGSIKSASYPDTLDESDFYIGSRALMFTKNAGGLTATITKAVSSDINQPFINLLDKIISFYVKMPTGNLDSVTMRFKDSYGRGASYRFPYTAPEDWTNTYKHLTVDSSLPTTIDTNFNYQNVTTIEFDVTTLFTAVAYSKILLDWITLQDKYNIDLVLNKKYVIKQSVDSYSFPNIYAGEAFINTTNLQNSAIYRGDVISAVVRNMPSNYSGLNLKIGLELQ